MFICIVIAFNKVYYSLLIHSFIVVENGVFLIVLLLLLVELLLFFLIIIRKKNRNIKYTTIIRLIYKTVNY
jgi:hypothetical protein